MTRDSSDARASAATEVKIGISSWTDLPGFYPEGIKANARLGWYARSFDVVEINTSFYRVVAPHVYQRWLSQTPTSLTFDIKAFRELTHERHESTHNVFREFRNSLDPLRTDRRLGAILFQFPPGFVNSQANRAYVAALSNLMPGDRIAVEFRHASWLDDEHRNQTIELLRDRNIALAVIDEPSLPPRTIPLVPVATSGEVAYVRLHGRNAQGWSGDREQRYAYDYSQSELEAMADIVRSLSRESREVHVLFNNNSTGAGTVNAQQLAKILGVAPSTTLEEPLRQATLLDAS